jgi:hypothetical protein
VNEGEVGTTVLTLGCRETQEDHPGTLNRIPIRRVEADEITIDGPRQQVGQTLLVYRDTALIECGHPLGARLTDPHPMAQAGEPGPRDQANVPGADDC